MGDRFRNLTHMLFLVPVLVAGCRSTRPAEREPALNPIELTAEVQEPAPHPNAPIIRAGHVVSVRVMSRNRIEVDEPDLRVSGSGRVTLPLLRDVSIEGMTLERARIVLTGLYKEYLRDPAVTIDFVMADRLTEMDSPWGYVTVLGCVVRPGQVSIPPTGRLTVTAAIQAAGGTAKGARISNVQVSRQSPPETIRVNLHRIGNDNRHDGGLPLRNGDVIFVPEGLF